MWMLSLCNSVQSIMTALCWDAWMCQFRDRRELLHISVSLDKDVRPSQSWSFWPWKAGSRDLRKMSEYRTFKMMTRCCTELSHTKKGCVQNVLVSLDKQVFSRLAITEVHNTNKSFTACLNQYLRSVILPDQVMVFTWLASLSLPSLLQIYNLKRDPIVSLEINKQRRIIKCETGGQLNLLGSEQPCNLGKEMRNSCYRLRLLLINWTARQTIWWQQDLVLMSFQKGETTLSCKEQLQWSPAI